MPNLFDQFRTTQTRGGTGSSNLFDQFRPPSRRAGGRKQPSLDELREQVGLLEREQQAIGARDIASDRPGIFATLLDVLSRPNFAIAGATEELLQGKSVSSAASRALSEIFSGLGPIEGQKRAFGQVLEGQGVGTKTLADAIPALEGTWVGNFGSRGAAGLALDILTDPLTYMGFGTLAAGRVALVRGGKNVTEHLTAAGIRKMAEIRALRFGDEMADALKLADDPVKLEKALDTIDRKVGEVFTEQFSPANAPELFDKGGAKIFGATIPGTSGLGRKFSAQMVKAANAIPGGDVAMKQASELSKAMQRGINNLFSPFGEFSELAGNPELRARAIKLKRDFRTSTMAINGRMVAQHKPLEKIYRSLEKADAKIGEKFYRVQNKVDGATKSILTDEQAELFDQYNALFVTMRDTLVDHGVLTKEQTIAGYFPSNYTNVKDLEQYHINSGGKFTGDISESFTKERLFDNPFQAAAKSAEDNAKALAAAKVHGSPGVAVQTYPILVPNFDIADAANKYISRYGESIARKAWREQAIHDFGKGVLKADNGLLYDPALHLVDKERGIIEGFLQDRGWANSLDDDHLVSGAPKVTLKAGDEAKVTATLAKLGPDAQEVFIAQIDRLAGSSEDWARIQNHLLKEGVDEKLFGKYHGAIKTGEVEPSFAKFLGDEEAAYVLRQGSFYGEATVSIPRAISRDIEQLNSKILNTADHHGFSKMLTGFDRVNNMFKLGVYTFWPASAIRDAYSNVANSMLDIGLGAINTKSHKQAVKVLHAIHAGKAAGKFADDLVELGGIRYRVGDLAKMAETFGVDVPGHLFAELTGDAAKRGTIQKTLSKAADYRGLIENEARVQLWINNMSRGLDPRRAADQVSEFLFNYGELAPAEREVMRRLIPFYTFTRKNIELQWKTLRKNPGMQINQLKPFRQRNDESEQMVKWEGEALAIRLDRDGKTVHMLTGIDLPLRNLDTLWRGTLGTTLRSQFGMVTPVLKTVLEVGAGRDFFTGRDLDRVQSGAIGRLIEKAHTPVALKNWMGYKKEVDDAGRPRYSFDGERFSLVFRSWMFSRLVSTSDRAFREYLQDDNFAGLALDFLTGIRDKELNMDEQALRKYQLRKKEIEDSLVRRGARAQFTRRFAPKEPGELQ